jgi:hypothetical protein
MPASMTFSALALPFKNAELTVLLRIPKVARIHNLNVNYRIKNKASGVDG